uniref:Uncharacterized protein n=1 Tax=Clandestinovirus TaxID=2831644 RepID=A0A8F8PKD7_9VIRU|nr:hypothetical protein KOM_12_398 [Clandestinovirus]
MGVVSKKNTKKKAASKKSVSRKVGKRTVSKNIKRKPTKKAGKRKRPTPRQVPNYKKRNYARPSPAVSATLFPAGKKMRGNDGNWYKISTGTRGIHRWVKISM